MLVPDALRFRGQEHNKLRLLLLHPFTFHAFLFGVPVLCFVTVLTPALVGNCIFNKVPAMHRLWLERSHDPSVTVTQLAAEARDIWLDVTHAYYYDSVVFGSEWKRLDRNIIQPLLTPVSHSSLGCMGEPSSMVPSRAELLLMPHLLS